MAAVKSVHIKQGIAQRHAAELRTAKTSVPTVTQGSRVFWDMMP